jgi:hypothetical protein
VQIEKSEISEKTDALPYAPCAMHRVTRNTQPVTRNPQPETHNTIEGDNRKNVEARKKVY